MNLKSRFLFFATLFGGIGLIYGRLLSADAFIDLDDSLVIGRMMNVHSLGDYLNLIQSGFIYDRQPVRDLITALDYFFLNHFDLSVFHLTNILIWVFLVLGVRGLFRRTLSISEQAIDFISLLFAFSPLYVSSVAWLTSRKHLLAGAFIVWATGFFLDWIRDDSRSFRKVFLFTLFYALAVFSQPIGVVWPLWCLGVLVVLKMPTKWFALIPSFLVMAAGIGVNYFYYSGASYLANNGGNSKFVVVNADFYPRLTLVGRYLFQLLLPFWTSAAAYGPGSWQNYVGMLLAPLLIYFLIKRLDRKFFLIWGAFFMTLIGVVIVRLTNVFGHDTYLLSASVGFYILFWTAIQPDLAKLSSRIRTTAAVVLLFLAIGLSAYRATAWESSLDVFRQAYELEPTSLNLEVNLASTLFAEGKISEAGPLIEDLYQKDPQRLAVQGLAAAVILRDQSIDARAKIEKLIRLKLTSSYALAVRSNLELELGNTNAGYRFLLQAFQTNRPSSAELFFSDPEAQLAKLYEICLAAKELYCSKTVLQLLREKEYKEAVLFQKLGELGLQQTFEREIKSLK